MQEKTLLLIASIAICIGLPALFFAAHTELAEKKTSIAGTVTTVVHKPGLTIAHITTDVPIVYFKKTAVQKGDQLTAHGRVHEYKGQIEFIAD